MKKFVNAINHVFGEYGEVYQWDENKVEAVIQPAGQPPFALTITKAGERSYHLDTSIDYGTYDLSKFGISSELKRIARDKMGYVHFLDKIEKMGLEFNDEADI